VKERTVIPHIRKSQEVRAILVYLKAHVGSTKKTVDINNMNLLLTGPSLCE
jgi:hypothetical protein